MKELAEIINAYDKAEAEGKQCAMATVVLVEGSSYRRAGARMLVTIDGQLTGAISGGCLEGDALRKAQLVMSRQKPMLVTYDTMDDDDAKLGVGLGCNGIIHILIEPIIQDEPANPIQMFKSFTRKRQKAVLVTIFSLEDRHGEQPGTCLLLEADGKVSAGLDVLYKENLVRDAGEVLLAERSQNKIFIDEREYTIFFELLQPPVSLVIAGAGNDTIPVSQIASVLGWHITLVDGRANYATRQRFPLANDIVVSKPEGILDKIEVDEWTAVLLMTHNYNYDLALLKQLLSKNVRYIGVLGPKKKLQRMQDELFEQGIHIQEEKTSLIFGPTGLDIGAETSEEIALSILSEIKAVFSGKPGLSLRNKETFIHSRESL